MRSPASATLDCGISARKNLYSNPTDRSPSRLTMRVSGSRGHYFVAYSRKIEVSFTPCGTPRTVRPGQSPFLLTSSCWTRQDDPNPRRQNRDQASHRIFQAKTSPNCAIQWYDNQAGTAIGYCDSENEVALLDILTRVDIVTHQISRELHSRTNLTDQEPKQSLGKSHLRIFFFCGRELFVSWRVGLTGLNVLEWGSTILNAALCAGNIDQFAWGWLCDSVFTNGFHLLESTVDLTPGALNTQKLAITKTCELRQCKLTKNVELKWRSSKDVRWCDWVEYFYNILIGKNLP